MLTSTWTVHLDLDHQYIFKRKISRSFVYRYPELRSNDPEGHCQAQTQGHH